MIIVFIYATYLHANLRFNVEWLKPIFATPRFHHWHHADQPEAIDKNFAIHFPIIDKIFGTYYMPKGQWPEKCGVADEIPSGYVNQLLYPFKKKKS